MSSAIACFQLVTSGIEADNDLLLEIAVTALDRETLQSAMNVTPTFHALIATDMNRLAATCPAKLWDKYEENGLLEQLCRGGPMPREEVDAELAAWLDAQGCSGSPKSPLAAFGADWTAQWLARHLPRSLERLGKDRIDLGSLCRAATYYPERSNDNARIGVATGARILSEALRAVRCGQGPRP